MTNKERLISLIGFKPENNALDGALLDYSITPGDTYILASKTPLIKAAIQLAELLLTMPDTSFNNGATTDSVNFDRATLLKRIQMWRKEVGMPDYLAPSIKNVSYLW